ncbi:MAG: hypothetical protein EXX96DRAFT_556407 [Benjaminiella poitrasii]|nr:MAG: hypothetical protein EXX96DRAFT_556407 [Benjaminiella poitrasii]
MSREEKETEELTQSMKNITIKEDVLIDVDQDESSSTLNQSTNVDDNKSNVSTEEELKKDMQNDTTNLANNQQQETNHSRQFQTDMPAFDFHRFLEQMKDPSANPIARYTKGFINAFHRREAWTVNEQIKFIQDFLNFTYGRMRDCDVWRDISEKEFENAKEGMEKLVMNRLFNVTFSPRTMDDKEKDEILYHKIKIFSWIREEHLDIPKTDDNDSFLTFAEAELLKMNNYKAPRDKLICILNCCKVIFGLMKHMERDEGADVFLPLLIYVVIRANPPRLISNAQYISRFRNPEHLRAEAGYYLTNLMGAIEFIETMDVNSLSISQEEFDANIEKTMIELAKEEPKMVTEDKRQVSYENAVHPLHAKKAQQQQPLIDLGSDIAQKSLSFVEKLFSDSSASNSESELHTSGSKKLHHHHHHHHDSNYYVPNSPSSLSQELPLPANLNTQLQQETGLQTENAGQEFDEHLSTIVSMFPNIEPGVCFMVLQACEGKLPETIERLLDMSNDQV